MDEPTPNRHGGAPDAQRRVQEGMRLLARLFEKTPGLAFFTPEYREDGHAVIILAVREETEELARVIPRAILGVPVLVRTLPATAAGRGPNAPDGA